MEGTSRGLHADAVNIARSHFGRLIWLLLLIVIVPSLSAANTVTYTYASLSQASHACWLNAGYNPLTYTVTADCKLGANPVTGWRSYEFAAYYNPYGPANTNYYWYDFAPTTTGIYESPKNLGCDCTKTVNSPWLGDPINAATGNVYASQDDFTQGDLSLSRHYNSDPYVRGSHIGLHWLNTYDRSLSFLSTGSNGPNGNPSSPTQVTVQRQDGRELIFNKVNGVWRGDADVSDVLAEVDDNSGYVLSWTLFVAATRQYETYSPTGSLLSVSDGTHVLLTLTYTDGTQQSSTGSTLPVDLLWKVTDAHGRALSFHYDSSPSVTALTQPDGGVLIYGYDSNGNLTSVTYPDGKQRQYLYDESAYSAAGGYQSKLTGVLDEGGTRYTTFGYQRDGRAISTQEGNGANLHTISYASDGSTATISYPLGQQATVTFTAPQGTAIIKSMSARCGEQCNQQYKSQTLDTNSYPATATDFNGNVTKTTYDVNGLLNQQIEASGTSSQRTTNFTWNMSLRVPLTQTVLNANGNTVSNTQWVYNTTGQTLAHCEIDPTNSAATGYTCSATGTVPSGVRRWTYTYCTTVDTTQCPIVGLMLTATGPRTDTTQTTTYSYYIASSTTSCGTPGAACYMPGDLRQVIDPLGHVIFIASYDADGRPTRITDANGANTDMTYTPRGWLASRNVGGATTRFTYTPYGSVQTVTDPDGVVTTYGYDAAHRLVKITDAQSNYVQYTLDAAGNKTAEQVYDSTGALHKNLSRTFNMLGQLTKVMDGLSHSVFDASASNSYDANGNLVQSADGLGIQRQLGYDALNRLVQTIDNYNGTN